MIASSCNSGWVEKLQQGPDGPAQSKKVYYLALYRKKCIDPFPNLTHKNNSHKNGPDGRTVGKQFGAWQSLQGRAPKIHHECGLLPIWKTTLVNLALKGWTCQTSDALTGLHRSDSLLVPVSFSLSKVGAGERKEDVPWNGFINSVADPTVMSLKLLIALEQYFL